jgi:hypothetical protein
MNTQVKPKRSFEKQPNTDSVYGVETVSHKFIKSGLHHSEATGVGPGDVDAGRARSRGSKPDELGATEAGKVDKTEGSVGGSVAAGEVAYYDQARLAMRRLGVFLPPRVNEETSELVKYLAVALREAAAADRRLHQTRDDLKAWKAVDKGVRRRSASYDMSLSGNNGLTLGQSLDAAEEQLASLDLTPDPAPDRRSKLSLTGGGTITRKRAEAAWQEQLRSSGINF